MRDEPAAIGLIVFCIVLVVGGVIGWVANIVTIAQSDFVLTGMLVVRVVGIFIAPLGAVLGYF
jgi:hypothetical protein